MISKIISTNPAIMADEIQRLKEGLKDSVGALRSLTAKNLNSYPYRDTTETKVGITFTDNGDGTITVSGIASVTTYFYIHHRIRPSTNSLILPNGKYRLSGCPSSGSSDTYKMRAAVTLNGSSALLGSDTGNGIIIDLTGDDYSNTETTLGIYIDVYKDVDLTVPITFKPMLELISLADPEVFATYSETNNQLTSDVDKLKCKETTAGSYYLTATVDSEGAITYSWEDAT